MSEELRYEGSIHYEPQQVEVLWKGNEISQKMEKGDSYWYLEADLPEGEHYYKFLVDGELELTDLHNNLMEPDEEGNIWSVIIISEEGQRLYNPKTFALRLKNYYLQNRRTEKPVPKDRKCFCIGQERQAVAYFIFDEVTGIHSVTAAWYAPDGELYEYAENLICETEEEEVTVCFWINLEGLEEKQGMWKLGLFVDGQKVMEDLLTVYKQDRAQISHQV